MNAVIVCGAFVLLVTVVVSISTSFWPGTSSLDALRSLCGSLAAQTSVVARSVWDVAGEIVLAAGVVVTFLAFALAFRTTLFPGESSPDHPKRSILRKDR